MVVGQGEGKCGNIEKWQAIVLPFQTDTKSDLNEKVVILMDCKYISLNEYVLVRLHNQAF